MEIKDYNVLIDGRNFFNQLIKTGFKKYDNIRKIAVAQGDDYTPGCLLDYPYFEKYYKLIAIHLSKQPKLDADSKKNQKKQQINFTGNLTTAQGTIMFSIIKEAKETILDFSKGTVELLGFNFFLI